jgi:hypothetical protein
MENRMVFKRKINNPQGYLLAGMAFFLIGIFAAQVADGRLIGAFFTRLIPDGSLKDTIQGFAGGFSIPMFLASGYFHLRNIIVNRRK